MFVHYWTDVATVSRFFRCSPTYLASKITWMASAHGLALGPFFIPGRSPDIRSRPRLPSCATERTFATARFSSTTGDPVTTASCLERGDPGPVRLLHRRRDRVAGRDRRLQPVRPASRRPAPAPSSPAAISSGPSGRGPGPAAAPARRTAPIRAADRDACSSISASSPCTSGSRGASDGQQRAQPQRLVAQRRPHPVVARRSPRTPR